MMDVRILHDGDFIHPSGAGKVAKELAKTFDAPITVGHTTSKDFWKDVEATFPFQSHYHSGVTGYLRSFLPRPYLEMEIGQLFRGLEFDEEILISTSVYSRWISPKYYQNLIHYSNAHPVHFYSLPQKGKLDWVKNISKQSIDKIYADYCSGMIANSKLTQARIQTHYGFDAPILHPPIETEKFYNRDSKDKKFVMICRLVEKKRVEMVAKAFKGREENLVIIGDGPMRDRCEALGAEVLGQISDNRLREEVSTALAGIAFAENEHCGMTPKEFQAAGKPVIVPDEPNLNNHVTPGVDGVIVSPTSQGIKEGIVEIKEQTWTPAEIEKTAEPWSTKNFRENAKEIVRDMTR